MNDVALPDGAIGLLKTAIANAIISAGGRTKAALLLGLSESYLSKVCNPDKPDVLSRDHLLLLGVSGGGAAFARFFAQFSHFEVVPLEDEPSTGRVSDDLISAIGRIAKEHSEAIAALVGAAQRGTPSAYREAVKEISELNRELDHVMRTLAATMARAL